MWSQSDELTYKYLPNLRYFFAWPANPGYAQAQDPGFWISLVRYTRTSFPPEKAASKLDFLELARYSALLFFSSRKFSGEPSYFGGDLKPSVFCGARFSDYAMNILEVYRYHSHLVASRHSFCRQVPYVPRSMYLHLPFIPTQVPTYVPLVCNLTLTVHSAINIQN